MLEAAPSLMAVTLLEELQRRYPEKFAESVLRTLQRRVGQWRAEHGGEQEIYFAQEHPPGHLGLSDFTVADELGVSLGGLAFSHRLYQFALAHSGWRHVRVVLGGESFQSLAAGLQDALWMAGCVPQEHRTDSLSLPDASGRQSDGKAGLCGVVWAFAGLFQASVFAAGYEPGAHRRMQSCQQ
jgi:hypothetical protein